MRFVIGADHGGYELKEQLIRYLKDMEHEILDVGTDSSDSVDYPDICKKACDIFISHGTFDRILLVCGTGIGMSMAANKYKNIRCGLVYTEECSILTRQHNDANVLALGARVTSIDNIKKIIDLFIKTEFEGGRHLNRINKL